MESRALTAAHLWKSGPSGPRHCTAMIFARFSATGPKGRNDHAANAAINGRSSTNHFSTSRSSLGTMRKHG